MLDFNPTQAEPGVTWSEIDQALRDSVRALVEHLRPSAAFNKHMSDSVELRYGSKGSMAVTVSGKDKGRITDFEASDTGMSPLGFIMSELFLNRSDAIAWAKDWLGIASSEKAKTWKAKPKKDQATLDAEAKAAAAEAEAKAREKQSKVEAIVAGCVDPHGTPAELYLRGRGINVDRLPDSVRYRPNAWGKFGAAVFLATDDAGTVQAVQQVYITADGKKADLAVQKRTNGPLAGAAVRLPGLQGEIILAEGPETALSIWMATGSEVWACLGVSNMAKAPVPPGSRVIVARDHDKAGAKADDTIDKTLAALVAKGCKVAASVPPNVGEDFNDVLQRDGAEAVFDLIAAAKSWPKFDPSQHQPHYDAPEHQGGEEAGKAQQQVIADFFTASAVFLRATKAFDAKRKEAFAAAGLDPEDDRGDERGAITRKIKKAIQSEFGVNLNDGPRWLANGAQGIGKTAATLKELVALRIPGLKAHVLVDTIDMADQIAGDYRTIANTSSLPVMAIRGREAKDPSDKTKKMCERHELAGKVARHGLEVQRTLCFNPDKKDRCPFYDTCAYQAQRSTIRSFEESGAVFVMSHEYAFTGSIAKSPDLVICDEDITRKAVPNNGAGLSFGPDRITEVGNWWQAGNRDIDAAANAADYLAVAEKVRAGITEHRGNELAYLRSVGVTVDAIKDATKYLNAAEEEAVSGIHPTMDDDAILDQLTRVEMSEISVVRKALNRVMREMETGRDHLVGVTFDPNKSKTVDGKTERLPRISVHFLRQMKVESHVPVLLLDGTGSLTLNRKVWGDRLVEHRVSVERQAEVVQVKGKTFSKSSLLGFGKGGAEIKPGSIQAATKLRREIVDFVVGQVEAGHGPVFVCTYKPVEELLCQELPANLIEDGDICLGHFGKQRGSNVWEDCKTAVVIGRQQTSPNAAEDIARCFFADDAEPLLILPGKPDNQLVKQSRARRMRGGSVTWETVEVHPDTRVQEILEQIREAETMQSVDRVRAVFNQRRMFLLSSMVVDLTVDKVVEWRELQGKEHHSSKGDRMVEVFKRTGFLPLSGRWLHHAAPDLFATEKAALRYLDDRRFYTPTLLIETLLGMSGCIRMAEFRHSGQKGPHSPKVVFDASRFPETEAAKVGLESLLNTTLSTFKVLDLDPAPAAEPQPAVVTIDENGLRHLPRSRPAPAVGVVLVDMQLDPSKVFKVASPTSPIISVSEFSVAGRPLVPTPAKAPVTWIDVPFDPARPNQPPAEPGIVGVVGEGPSNVCTLSYDQILEEITGGWPAEPEDIAEAMRRWMGMQQAEQTATRACHG